jgi:excisionase family DNA binding protein
MGHVYFIQENNSGAIKIGWSSNIKKRLIAMQTYNASQLKLLGAFNGTSEDEKRTQENFAKYRIKGEWFRPEKELMDFIEKHKVVEVPLDLKKAVKEFEGKPLTEAGKECRRLLELSEYHVEDIAEEKMFSIDEAANLLGVTQQTLRKWEEKGTIRPVRTDGGHRRYKDSDIKHLKIQRLGSQTIVVPGVTTTWLNNAICSILAPFEPTEKIDITLYYDPVLDKVQLIATSEDGLVSVNKSFNIKE